MIRRTKRPRIVNDDDDEDDEEAKPAGLGASIPDIGAAAPELAYLERTSARHSDDDRRVKLVVTMPQQTSITILVERSTIVKIPNLALQLRLPLDTSMQRHSIHYSTEFEDETIIQAIEFVEKGTLPPLTAERGPDALFKQLCEKIKLFDISQELDIAELEAAIILQLQETSILEADTFAKFASACYDRASGHRVQRASSLGLAIKVGLERFIPDMIASGTANILRAAGGPLAEELINIVWTRHETLERHRVARAIADRELAA